MDPNTILEYAAESTKWLVIGGALAYGTAMLSSPVSMFLSKKIRSKKELERVIDEESHKLGLNGIVGIYHKGIDEAKSYIRNGTGFIVVGGRLSKRSAVRHEAYHLYKRHNDPERKFKNNLVDRLDYYFVREPQASLYESMRVRI